MDADSGFAAVAGVSMPQQKDAWILYAVPEALSR